MPTIDELPAATAAVNSAEVAIWQGGSTLKCSRQLLLVAGAGEPIVVAAAGNDLTLRSDGSFELVGPGGAGMSADHLGAVDIRSQAGHPVVIQGGAGASLQLGILGGGPYISIESTFIEIDGSIFFQQGLAATILGSVIGKIPVHLPGGVTGYTPVYDAIT